MTNEHRTPPTDLDDINLDEEFPIQISVAPEYVARLEAVAARTGRTADQLIEDFMRRVFEPLGARITR